MNNEGYETMEILNHTKFITDLTWNQFYLQHNDNGQNNKMYFSSNDNITLKQSDLGRGFLVGGKRQRRLINRNKETAIILE